MCTEGMLTTCSSKILGNFIPTYSSEAVLNLQKAGAVVIGKTNMDEFAMGSPQQKLLPMEQRRIHGIQSMYRADLPVAPAAAVAADECFFALGSDTGGSIRQPAFLSAALSV